MSSLVRKSAAVASIAVALTIAGSVASQEIKKGEAAFGDWSADAPGVRRHIQASDMPKAEIQEEVVGNFPESAERPADAQPKLPDGFSADMIVSGLENPRIVRVAPNGDLFVANSKANELRVYRLNGNKVEKDDDN